MALDNNWVKELLLRENYISQEDLEKASIAADAEHTPLIDYLISQELVTKEILGQAIAEYYKIPFADFSKIEPDKQEIQQIPEEVAKKFRLVVFKKDQEHITLATDEPVKEGLVDAIHQIYPSQKVVLAYALSDEIDRLFSFYRQPLETRFAQIIKTQHKVAPEIIGEIIMDAITFRASDIHFEPREAEVVVRFRVDGVLQEAGHLSKEYYENILNRIKVQAHMRLDEHMSAQDGAIRFVKDNIEADLRVSVVPTLDGEKVAIRLLSQYIRDFALSDLGLSEKNKKIILDAAKKPFGMILVTGPTGSGKTTTLYALLKFLNHPDINITTIEDPVEYKIVGVTQIRVNTQTNLTFAKGLRSIVRQDPDIILVGEIRDSETAEIAVNAALTGHLLLSTFHAKTAAGGIPRLLDMGIEPFLLASTLELVIAQRLTRKICENCRTSMHATPEQIAEHYPDAAKFFTEDTTLYKGKGCKACNNSGYKGRIAIYEIISMNKELKELILTHPSSEQIAEMANKMGYDNLFFDGLEKVKSGQTTLEELLRVASVTLE